ncbi:MAG: DUF6455 family protein [Stappiaceae bacterium]
MGIFKKASDRLELFRKMMDRTDAKAGCGSDTLGEGDLKSGIVTCLSCRHEEACMDWLEDNGSQTRAPAFCANAMRLNKTFH